MKSVVVREASIDDAEQLVRMWSDSLGSGGIVAPGCEPYPDPSLFDVSAMRENINDPNRQIILAESHGTVLGAMIVDWFSPYHCEHNCMAVSHNARQSKLGSLLVEGALKLQREREIVINCTELVTHSLASQSAHLRHGFEALCGFGYAHYPKVFSSQHRESVLWSWQLLGTAARKSGQYYSHSILKQFCQREIFIPGEYQPIVSLIIGQLRSLIRYEFGEPVRRSCPAAIQVDPKEGSSHFYIDVIACGNDDALADAFDSAKEANKAFILARLNANDPGCAESVRWLKSRGFVFHSFLPLYRFDQRTERLSDLLCMQWVHPDLIRANPLPGESNSRIQLYGYPLNATGAIVSTIREDLRLHEHV